MTRPDDQISAPAMWALLTVLTLVLVLALGGDVAHAPNRWEIP